MITNIENRYSPSYVTTVNHHSEVGKEYVETLRRLVKVEDELNGTRRYVKLQGRMGKNNPNAYKYSIKNRPNTRYGSHSHQCIKLGDAAYADVYIYNR